MGAGVVYCTTKIYITVIPCELGGEMGGCGRCVFSLCTSSWFLRLLSLLKPFPHEEQLCGHSPLWMNMCDRKSPGVGKDLEQVVHLCGLSLMWVILW